MFKWALSEAMCCQKKKKYAEFVFSLQIQVNPTLNFTELALLASHVSLWGQETDLTQPQPSSSPSLPPIRPFLFFFITLPPLDM